MMTPLEEQRLLAMKYRELLTNTRVKIRRLALNSNQNHETISSSRDAAVLAVDFHHLGPLQHIPVQQVSPAL
jgi:hypothetical protein